MKRLTKFLLIALFFSLSLSACSKTPTHKNVLIKVLTQMAQIERFEADFTLFADKRSTDLPKDLNLSGVVQTDVFHEQMYAKFALPVLVFNLNGELVLNETYLALKIPSVSSLILRNDKYVLFELNKEKPQDALIKGYRNALIESLIHIIKNEHITLQENKTLKTPISSVEGAILELKLENETLASFLDVLEKHTSTQENPFSREIQGSIKIKLFIDEDNQVHQIKLDINYTDDRIVYRYDLNLLLYHINDLFDMNMPHFDDTNSIHESDFSGFHLFN